MPSCPYCFRKLDPMLALYACQNPGCADVEDLVLGRHTGVFAGPALTPAPPLGEGRKRRRAAGAVCRLCSYETRLEACLHCHHTLPDGWAAVETTCVVMAGAVSSGKSIYIGVVKNEIDRLAELMNVALGFYDAATAEAYQQLYEAPLYEQRGIMQSTRKAANAEVAERTPLLFRLGALNGRPHVLVIRDVAGEDLENRDIDPDAFGFFRHADLVMFMFDPVRVPAIRQMLTGLVPEQKTLGGDPEAVLDNLVRLLRYNRPPEQIEVPLATVLSKFDTLQLLREADTSDWSRIMRNAGAAYLRDTSLDRAAFDPDDAELLHAEVQSLMDLLGGKQLLTRVEGDFATWRLFAVSALGAPPSGSRLHVSGIAPFRCLDPIKWVLARRGVLKAA